MDLVPTEDREAFFQILQNTQRSRSTSSSLHWHASFGSCASSKSSWDISSASFYDSEVDASEHAVSLPPSRRPSANVSLPAMPEEEEEETNPPTSMAAMVAWRDALAAQIYHFQQSVHTSVSNFQLPALPPLPDYQDSAMMRRLSSLVPGRCSVVRPAADETQQSANSHQPPRFWDMFSSASLSTTAPPPAYSELFPDKTHLSKEQDSEKAAAVRVAVVDAAADEKCAVMFEQQASEEASGSSMASENVTRPSKTENVAVVPSWLWVSENPAHTV